MQRGGGVQVRHLDVMDFVSSSFRTLYTDVYLRLIGLAPSVWRYLYDLSNRTPPRSLPTSAPAARGTSAAERRVRRWTGRSNAAGLFLGPRANQVCDIPKRRKQVVTQGHGGAVRANEHDGHVIV